MVKAVNVRTVTLILCHSANTNVNVHQHVSNDNVTFDNIIKSLPELALTMLIQIRQKNSINN